MHKMSYVWRDYDPSTMGYIEDWLDKGAVKSTGLDEGFRSFYEYWAKEDGFVVGENFWCKIVFENDKPFALIAFCHHDRKIVIMEILVQPEKRGQGSGSKLLKELLEKEEIIGFIIDKCEAVIFPDNTASQRAFENAGFQCRYAYEDGSALYYVYERNSNDALVDARTS